jgi:hypothetical protein
MVAGPTPSTVKSSLPSLFFTDEMPRPYPTIFCYAIAGAGKTNMLRTVKHLNPLVLATEDGQTKGMSTLSDLHIPAMLIDTLDQLVAATTELASRAKPGELYYPGPDGTMAGPFGLLGVDSLTGVGPMLEDGAKKIKGWDMIWDAHAGGGKDPRTAYPYIAEKGRQVVRKLMSLPIPLVLLCREQMITEGEGQNTKSYPAPELPGTKLPRELPGWPEATVRLRMLNGQRVLQTENEGDVVARVRLREGLRLPKYCKPDLGALLRLLQGDVSALAELAPPSLDTRKTPQQLAAEQRRAAQQQS